LQGKASADHTTLLLNFPHARFKNRKRTLTD